MKNNIIGTLLRDIGLGFFVNGLFTITQNGFNINSVVVTIVAMVTIAYGIVTQNKGCKK